MYANAIRILSNGSLYQFPSFPQTKVKETLDKVKEAIQITNPDYDIVIKRLHMYYGMKLVTFDINKKRSLIVIFVQPYIQQQLILYQI